MKAFVMGIFTFLLTTSVWASDSSHPAENIVRATTAEVVDVLKENKPAAEVEKLINAVILPNFDFTQMSRWTLGKAWKTIPTEKQELFTDQFRTMLVGTYATALIEFDNQKIDVKPAITSKNPKLVFVPTVITQANADPLEIRYMMMDGAEGWKVVDIAIGGVSLIKNYRASYAAQIRKEGVDALIEKLVTKNQLAKI